MKLQKTATFSPTEQGNAIIITLVIIALLTALTFSIGRMSAKTSGNLSKEQARLAADQIMRIAQTYEGAIQRLVNVNRCSENDINFDNTQTTVDYDNTNAPTDGRCDIFNVAGAGLKYASPSEKFLDADNSTTSPYGEWVWNAEQCIAMVGNGDTTCSNDSEAELIMLLPFVREEVCVEINNLNGVTNDTSGGFQTPPTDIDTGVGFTGDFAKTYGILGITAGAELEGKATGCYKVNGGSWNGTFAFYHVLIVR